MSKQTRFPKITILGVEIDNLTILEAIEHISTIAREAPAKYVVKPYVEFFDRGEDEVLNNAYLSLPDSVATQWAAYFQTRTKGNFWDLIRTIAQIFLQPKAMESVLSDRFAGVNFTWALLEVCAVKGIKVYLVGSPKHSSISETVAYLKKRIPRLQITGSFEWQDERAGGQQLEQLREVLKADLDQKQPDLVLVGIGFPHQEKLNRYLAGQLEHGVLIGEGGTFDYRQFGGKMRRAPKFMRRAGLEWLWRLILEPSRIKRQLAIPRFIWKVYRARFTKSL